jgi:hypothetical protein
MNVHKIPGFTADASLYDTSLRYRSDDDRSFASGSKQDQVYMQKPNSQNTAGGKCTGHTSGTTITGTYDSLGRCCIYPKNGFPYCIDCDIDKCYDRTRVVWGGGLWSGVFGGGVFTTP